MSQSPNKNELYRMAIEAVKNGQKQPARMMFQQILQQDNRNTRVMMWMAKISNTTEERAKWLQQVLKVDPKNKDAKKAFAKIENKGNANRNRLYFRVGAGAYAILIIIISMISMFAFSPK